MKEKYLRLSWLLYIEETRKKSKCDMICQVKRAQRSDKYYWWIKYFVFTESMKWLHLLLVVFKNVQWSAFKIFEKSKLMEIDIKNDCIPSYLMLI